VEAVSVKGHTVQLQTHAAVHTEIFKHANISFEVKKIPEAWIYKSHKRRLQANESHASRKEQLGIAPKLDASLSQQVEDCTCSNGLEPEAKSIATLACALQCSKKIDISNMQPIPQGSPKDQFGVQECQRYLSGDLCRQTTTLVYYEHPSGSFPPDACDPYSNKCYCLYVPGAPVYSQWCWPSSRLKSAPLGGQVGGFWDFVSNIVKTVWHAAETVVKDTEHVVEAAASVLKIVATGDFQNENVESIPGASWNYDSSSGGAKEADIDLGNGFVCHECFFNLEASVHYDIVIKDYKLDHVAAWLEGDMNVNIDASLDTTSYHSNNSETVATIKVPEVTFTVGGIPMVIDTTIPVEVGYDAAVSEKGGTIRATGSLAGSIKKGVIFDSDDAQPHYINEHQLAPKGHLSGPAEVSAALQLYVFPKVSLVCDHIGGPTVGVKGILELVLDYQALSETCPVASRGAGFFKSEGGLFTNINFGMQVALGAKVDLELGNVFSWKKEWPSLLSHTFKWPLVSGCIAENMGGVGSDLFVQVPSHLANGGQPVATSVSYAGVLVPSKGGAVCDASPKIPIALQVTSLINAHLLGHQRFGAVGDTTLMLSSGQVGTWSLQTGGGHPYNPVATLQLPYVLTDGQLIATADPTTCRDNPSSEACYTFAQYTSSDKPVGVPLFTFNADLSSDMATITLTDSNPNGCYPPAMLSRSPETWQQAFSDLRNEKPLEVVI
jgi:hypothetical protein